MNTPYIIYLFSSWETCCHFQSEAILNKTAKDILVQVSFRIPRPNSNIRDGKVAPSSITRNSWTLAVCLRIQLRSDALYPETASNPIDERFCPRGPSLYSPLQTLVTSPACYPCSCLTSWHLVCLLQKMTELRETLTLASLLKKMLRDTNQQPQQGMPRASSWTKELVPGGLGPCLMTHREQMQKLSENKQQTNKQHMAVLWGFCGGCVAKLWRCKSLVLGWFTLSTPLPSLDKTWEWRFEPPITWLVLPAARPPLGGSKSHPH